MKLFYLLLSLSCAEPLEFYCENITYKYLLQKGERIREHHRATLGRSKDAERSLSALCSTGYLEFYRELMLSTRTCPVTLETQIPGDEEVLEFPRNPEKEWTKNFASPECGSKLVKSSENLKNAPLLITRSNDEYMLNECSKKVWFVIELCETIKVTRFELENHELYAGTPEIFSISVAHKYSPNSKDWTELGNFTSEGEKKTVEIFENPEKNVFGKFVKVNIRSNYGDEHYCTLTSFRVFGVSEYEVVSDDNHDSEDHLEPGENPDQAPAQPQLAVSPLNEKMRQISLLSSRREVERSKNSWTIVQTFRFLQLQLRNDTCIDALTLKILQKETKLRIEGGEGEGRILGEEGEVRKLGEMSGEGRILGEGVIKVGKEEGGGKESILVKLNSRLKSLEKNTTSLSLLVKKLNMTSSIQTSDMERILEAVIRAKESFQESSREQSSSRSRMRSLTEKVVKLEENIQDSSNTIKIIVFSLILLAGLFLYLVCSLEPRGRTERITETRETGTMTDMEENMKIVSSKVESPLRTERRSTWCGRGNNGNISSFNQPTRRNEPIPVYKRIREIQGDECGSIIPYSTPSQVLNSDNQTIDDILAILNPRSLEPIPEDGWSPSQSVTPKPQAGRLNPIPEYPELDSSSRGQGSQEDSLSGSTLLDLLQGGVMSPKPGSTPNRRVTWCGGGSIPYSGQTPPSFKPRS